MGQNKGTKDENRLRIDVGPSCTTEPLCVEFWPRVSELSTSPSPSTSSSVGASVTVGGCVRCAQAIRCSVDSRVLMRWNFCLKTNWCVSGKRGWFCWFCFPVWAAFVGFGFLAFVAFGFFASVAFAWLFGFCGLVAICCNYCADLRGNIGRNQRARNNQDTCIDFSPQRCKYE